MLSHRQMSKQQLSLMTRDTERAIGAALRAHFMGQGAMDRTGWFVAVATLSSLAWMGRFLCLFSWAAASGLLLGPDHEFFLTHLRAWMVEIPLQDVLAQSHAWFMGALVCAAKLGLIFGVGQRLLDIIKPVIYQVRATYLADLSFC